MMKKILISVCGEGFGHTTRCIAVGEALKDDYEIAYIAYGKSKDFIAKYNYPVFETFPEIKLKGKDGKFDIKSSIFNKEYSPKKAVKKELKIIKEYNPDLVISDCKYSTVVAAKLLKKPVMCISNQNYTRYKLKTDLIVYPTMKALNMINERCEKFIVPDFPLPYTICEYNLKIIKNMEFIGPLIRYDIDYSDNNQNNTEKGHNKDYNVDNDYILSVIGGFEYRYKILEKLGNIALKNDLKVKLVCGSYDVAKRLKRDLHLTTYKNENIEIIPITTDMKELIKNAEFVVSHGGHSTIMESLSFGKPLIVIPDLDHPEQGNNAKKVNDLGCGIHLSYKNLEKLEEAIFDIRNLKFYKRNALKMKELAQKYNGKKNIKKIVDEFFETRKNLRKYYLTNKLINKFRPNIKS
ncbi:Glycosyltransferase 28 domain protein [Methanocaldococcus vulcanius M7]|uniref:Glycosyltransferase 28 domain protein n=1 Tax=Methanocaldococcus vulcanius (strain ATCC 700851 / DSM 12094 / M7) TaxID=579137 RepID=C9RGG4_METVM|nr:MJ1255/VC2487 family glycosyltransferase [Methanocaldococcus vulcanius]ACX72666.1 Glycosyltransferase 28 domain protein [Methanocaldococcus vulcanius M7]